MATQMSIKLCWFSNIYVEKLHSDQTAMVSEPWICSQTLFSEQLCYFGVLCAWKCCTFRWCYTQ